MPVQRIAVLGSGGGHVSQSASEPRPGSRADRMAQPLSRDVLRGLAEHAGVCVRPLAVRRVDRVTGAVDLIDIPCGARLASKCKPCAERNRRLRRLQIREGWHLSEEPSVPVEPPSTEALAVLRLRAEFLFERDLAVRNQEWAQVRDLDQGIADVDAYLATRRVRGTLPKPGQERQTKPRTTRSTKRRQDAPPLPRSPIAKRTIGRTYKGKDGRQHQPSMLLTTTLPGFGPVHTGKRMRRGQLKPCPCGRLHGQADPQLGTPLDPDTYDYRGHALGLIFFPHLLDRFWQNYRRANGWKVQYAGTVEMQRRLATHAHFAVRGTAPRALTRQVAAATYHQVWWPSFDTMKYTVDRPPIWDEAEQCYVDPKTHEPLTPWDDAMEALSTQDGVEPAHVARLGTIDLRGVEAGTEHAERAIRYATKYITKDLVDPMLVRSEPQRAHADRLHQELSVRPCSPRCANWLLYGIQPDKARHDLIPGRCRGKVHQRATLGYTGRRVLVSRNWSGKTLTDHRLDGRDWFRAITAGLLDDQADTTEAASDRNRYVYRIARRNDRDLGTLTDRILRSIAARTRARTALQLARGDPSRFPASATPTNRAALAA
jgi:hypothetical protein